MKILRFARPAAVQLQLDRGDTALYTRVLLPLDHGSSNTKNEDTKVH